MINLEEKINEEVFNKSLKDELENDIRHFLTFIDDSNTNLLVDKFEEIGKDVLDGYEDSPYYILELDGGLNGCGRFLFYMEDVSKLIKKLMLRFKDVWLIDWINDCPDDVFTLRLGMRI